MRKNIKIIIILMLVIIELSTMFLMYKSLSNKEIELDNVKINKVDKKAFAVLLEQEDGTYQEVDTWPNDGYVYDSAKSGCMDENGIEIENSLLFDTSTNIVSIQTNKTSYCYLYFKQPVCKIAADSTVAAGLEGAKYNCKVDPNKDAYTFYLLDNNEDGTSDLIMNANINAAGEAVIPGVTEDTGTVAWNDNFSGKEYGPVTAMEYLHNATKSWTNVEPVNYTYNNAESQEDQDAYKSFESADGIAIITSTQEINNTIGNITEPLRARMPIYIYGSSESEVMDENIGNSFLYENLDPNSSIDTYWTMSSLSSEVGRGYVVYADGDADGNGIYDEMGFILGDLEISGVRPVITVKL